MLAALKWVIEKPNIATTIPSMTDMDQLDENLKAMANPLSASDEKLLAAHLERIRPLYCRMCGQCDGACAKGSAGGRCAALPHLCRRLRPVRAGPRALQGTSGRTCLGPLRRLRRMHG